MNKWTDDEREIEQRHKSGDHSTCDQRECDWAQCSQVTYVGCVDSYYGGETEYCENQVQPQSQYCRWHDGD